MLNKSKRFFRTAAICTVSALACIGVASAQNLDKFVITGEKAARALTRNEIPAETAIKITQACLDFAVKNNVAVTVFVHAGLTAVLGPQPPLLPKTPPARRTRTIKI